MVLVPLPPRIFGSMMVKFALVMLEKGFPDPSCVRTFRPIAWSTGVGVGVVVVVMVEVERVAGHLESPGEEED